MSIPIETRVKLLLPLLAGATILGYIMALSAFWAIYCVYQRTGVVGAVVAFFFSSVMYKLGPAPLFAAAVSMLHFYLNAVPLWVPIASYFWAVITLGLQLLMQAGTSRQGPSEHPT